MRTFFRLALIAAAAQFAVACTSSMSAMNPFDGDPNGPPPAPHMWDGAYAGDQEGPVERVAREDTRRAIPVRERETRVASAESDYDRSYGTNNVESSELPPPSEDRSYDEPPRREEPAPREERRASRDDGEQRTLTTLRPGEHAVEARPTPRTVTHRVGKGEELSDIADNYGVREVDIIALNSLRPPYALKNGQELQIPARETAAAPSEGDYVKAGDVAVPRSKPEIDGGRAAEPKPTKEASADGPRFDWPVSGKVISNFGASGDGLYNEGINIAVPVGTPVRAAAGGTIRYAGNELRGYGNLVLIEHTGGYVTAYAHNDSLKVKRGDKVARGDVIALSGKTGNVKSPQLHFEIRKGTESVDPRKHLVAKAS